MTGETGRSGPIRKKGGSRDSVMSGTQLGPLRDRCNRPVRAGWQKPQPSRINARKGLKRTMIRILLAEDDNSMRIYLARALERTGYHVVAVDNGAAAIP